jgi:hypothetical protein
MSVFQRLCELLLLNSQRNGQSGAQINTYRESTQQVIRYQRQVHKCTFVIDIGKKTVEHNKIIYLHNATSFDPAMGSSSGKELDLVK